VAATLSTEKDVSLVALALAGAGHRVVFLVAPLIRWLDRASGWSWLNLTPDGARTILGAFTSSMRKSELNPN
jgi:hypothetical protein